MSKAYDLYYVDEAGKEHTCGTLIADENLDPRNEAHRAYVKRFITTNFTADAASKWEYYQSMQHPGIREA